MNLRVVGIAALIVALAAIYLRGSPTSDIKVPAAAPHADSSFSPVNGLVGQTTHDAAHNKAPAAAAIPAGVPAAPAPASQLAPLSDQSTDVLVGSSPPPQTAPNQGEVPANPAAR